MRNETIATSISVAILACLALVYGALMATLAEPVYTEASATCTYGCPLQGSGRRRVDGLTECLYAEGKLIETRERLPEYQYIRVCELTYDLEGSESPLTRQYIVTY